MRARQRLVGIVLTVWTVGIAPAPPRAAEAAGEAADSIGGVLEECRVLRLAPQGRHVHDTSVTFGHMQISFADGTLVPVLGQSGLTLGAYFEGRGGYLYTTSRPSDRDALAINAARISNALRPVAGRVSDDLKSVLLLFAGPELTDMLAGGDDGGGTEALVPEFQRRVADALNTYGEFDFRLALARMNGKGRWVYVEMSGGLEHVGYVFDDLVDGRERLFGFRKLGDYNVRFSETISLQELPGWSDGARLQVVLEHADIAIATEDNKSGTIDSDLTLQVHKAGTRLLRLDLLNNRDPDSADWRSPRQKLAVKRVTNGDGKDLPFAHRYGEIVVEIPPTPVADSSVRLRFETEGEVFVDMRGRHTDHYFSLEGASWYPSPPGWAGQRFSYALKVKVKKPWRPVTSGHEVSLKDDGKFITAESRSDQPSMQIAVMAGKYFTRQQTIDGFTVRVHSYAWNRKDVLDNMPKLAAAFVKLFGSMLGPLETDELDIVEVPAYGFGISPSGMVLITSEAYWNVHTKLASGVNARLAHEIAHQWFGHRAVPAEVSDNWLAESFAEYFAGIAMGTLASDEKAIHGFEQMLIDWRTEAKLCTNGGTIATANYLGGEHSWDDRACLLYDRGPLVLHMLRTSIGNDRFFTATKKFLDAAKGGAATTDDFASAVSGVVQMDMGWYFDQWVRTSGVAVVDIEQHVDPAAGGQYRLWGTITQAPGAGFKKLLIPLVWATGGKTEARVVFADQPEKKFEFLLPAKPGSIKPDPFQNNLAVYK